MQNHSADSAVYYLTECTLATIEIMASTKRQSKSEIDRQINIAQIGIDYIVTVDRTLNHRVEEVIRRHNGYVLLWAECLKR